MSFKSPFTKNAHRNEFIDSKEISEQVRSHIQKIIQNRDITNPDKTEISRFNRTCGSLHRLKNPPRPSSENSIEIACGNSETDQDAQIGHSPPKQISRACKLEESSGSSKPVGSNTKFIPHGFLGSSNPEFKDLMKDYLLGKVRWVAGKDARTFATIKERNGRDTNLICLFP